MQLRYCIYRALPQVFSSSSSSSSKTYISLAAAAAEFSLWLKLENFLVEIQIKKIAEIWQQHCVWYPLIRANLCYPYSNAFCTNQTALHPLFACKSLQLSAALCEIQSYWCKMWYCSNQRASHTTFAYSKLPLPAALYTTLSDECKLRSGWALLHDTHSNQCKLQPVVEQHWEHGYLISANLLLLQTLKRLSSHLGNKLVLLQTSKQLSITVCIPLGLVQTPKLWNSTACNTLWMVQAWKRWSSTAWVSSTVHIALWVV